jgi:hypothetical protein
MDYHINTWIDAKEEYPTPGDRFLLFITYSSLLV